MACISVLFSPVGPSTSSTSPYGICSFSGHSVMRTTAFSPVRPPRSLFRGITMSVARNFESVTSVPMCFPTRKVPIKVCCLRSIISVTFASGSRPRTRAATLIATRSPLSACMELRSATKIVSPSASVTTLFFPLLRRTNVPVATTVRCTGLKRPGDTSSSTPSKASSARYMAMERWCVLLCSPMAAATCL